MSLEEQILQAVTEVMPPNVEVRVEPGRKEFKVRVSWKLNDDPERPNKTSKILLICVSHEAVEDYATASCIEQEAAYRRIVTFLSAKLATFDPQHNEPIYKAPPVVRWVITPDVVRS